MKIALYIKYIVLISLLIILSIPASAQKELKHARKGNRSYRSTQFEEAELDFRRSIENNSEYIDASFNLGDALYKQEKYEEATKSFSSLAKTEIKPQYIADTYFNLGNTLLKNNNLEESIEAYKESLRVVPGNTQAKYNLAYAQDLLKKQEQEQKDQEDQDKNKDKDKKDDESDQNKDEQDQKDKEDNEQDQNQDKENNDQEKEQNEQNEPQMSKEDVERLLQALAADEQAVQEKVKMAKAAKARVKTLKNW